MKTKNLQYPKNLLKDLKEFVEFGVANYEHISVMNDFVNLADNVINDKTTLSKEQLNTIEKIVLSTKSKTEEIIFTQFYMLNETSAKEIQKTTGLTSVESIISFISKILENIIKNDLSRIVYGEEMAAKNNLEFKEWLTSFPLITPLSSAHFNHSELIFLHRYNIYSIEPLIELIKMKPKSWMFYLTNLENDITFSKNIIKKLIKAKFLNEKYLELMKAEN